jgi:DNA repair protein RadD
MHPLRDYQIDAIRQTRDAYRNGARKILLVAPTGAGKTRIATEFAKAALAKSDRGIVLWIAHRAELIEQGRKALVREGAPEELIGVIQSGRRFHRDARIQVASIQTLVAMRARGGQLPKAHVAILDEAHHFAADEWGEVVKEVCADGAGVLGLTATPERGDGRALGDLFERLIQVSSVAELTAMGVLVPAKVIAPESPGKDLAADPVDAYRQHADGQQGFVFCPTVPHAEDVCERFRVEGIPAAVIHADTKKSLREAFMVGFSTQNAAMFHALSGEGAPPRVLCNVFTLTEGVDVPAASVCILARRMGHPGMYLQCVGRVLRAAPGKTHATVIDLTGNALPPPMGHGLPDAERDYSLEGAAIKVRGKDDKDHVTHCKVCGCVITAWRTNKDNRRECPHCGAVGAQVQPMGLDERPLHELGSMASQEAKVEAYRRLLLQGMARDYKPAWPGMRFKELFGYWPLPSVRQAAEELVKGVTHVRYDSTV